MKPSWNEMGVVESLGYDPLAATRRAIVKAAALCGGAIK